MQYDPCDTIVAAVTVRVTTFPFKCSNHGVNLILAE